MEYKKAQQLGIQLSSSDDIHSATRIMLDEAQTLFTHIVKSKIIICE